MAGSRGPRLGPAIYRSLDGVSEYACTIVMVDGWKVNVQVFEPQCVGLTFYRGIDFHPEAGPASAAPGTCYQW